MLSRQQCMSSTHCTRSADLSSSQAQLAQYWLYYATSKLIAKDAASERAVTEAGYRCRIPVAGYTHTRFILAELVWSVFAVSSVLLDLKLKRRAPSDGNNSISGCGLHMPRALQVEHLVKVLPFLTQVGDSGPRFAVCLKGCANRIQFAPATETLHDMTLVSVGEENNLNGPVWYSLRCAAGQGLSEENQTSVDCPAGCTLRSVTYQHQQTITRATCQRDL